MKLQRGNVRLDDRRGAGFWRVLARTLVATVGVGVLAGGPAHALPNEFAQEGLLIDDDGLPMEGRRQITVRMYAAAAGGAPLFQEIHPNVDLFEGYYFVAIGSRTNIDKAMFVRNQLYYSISVDDGPELLPRTPMRKVPVAMVADVAYSVKGDIDVTSLSVGGSPVVNDAGRWVGDPTGLVGPQGPIGPIGPRGIQGAVGPAGDAGAATDPNVVVPLVVQELAANPGSLPYLRKNANDSTTGILTISGRLEMTSGGVADSIRLNNNNIVGVNAITTSDPGPNEGLLFGGTQAKIVVSGLANEDRDGYLRLINDEGISLESTVRIAGKTDVFGTLTSDTSVTAPVGTFTTVAATTGNITTVNGTTANFTTVNTTNLRANTMTSAGGVMTFNTELQLNQNVRLGGAMGFVGTVRAGGVESAGTVTAAGSITAGGEIVAGSNLRSGASVIAEGNVQAGDAGGRLISGSGGIWVRGIQVFDGNGNLLRRPVLTCAAGSVVVGTDANGIAQCVNVQCPAGQYFRGFDGNLNRICQVDATGLASVPANNCAAGQAIVAIAANGATTCGWPRTGTRSCPAGQFVNSIADNGSLSCAAAAAVAAGDVITPNGVAFGHHGACSGWNGCGNGATCAQWACEVRGYAALVSSGAERPCTQFAMCHLFFNRGNLHENWGNWCDVAGVTDIRCRR